MADDTVVRIAIIPVAGTGSRMGPLGRLIPKELLPLQGMPILAWILDELRSAGLRQFHLITSKEKPLIGDFVRQISAFLGESLDITVWQQSETSMGNYGAALSVPATIRRSGPYLIVWGDEVFAAPAGTRSRAAQLISAFERYGRPVLGCKTVPDAAVEICGILDVDDEGRITRVIEKPGANITKSRLALVGGAVVPPVLDEWLSGRASEGNEEQVFSELLGTWPRLGTVRYECLESEWWELGSARSYIDGVIGLEERGVLSVKGGSR